MQWYEVPKWEGVYVTLKEYVVKKPMDIKFKLNEKTKVSVHSKYEYV